MMVMRLSEFFRMCLAAVTPDIPFPIMTICSSMKLVLVALSRKHEKDTSRFAWQLSRIKDSKLNYRGVFRMILNTVQNCKDFHVVVCEALFC